MTIEDSWVLGVISFLVLLYSLMVVRNARKDSRLYKYQAKRTRGLIENSVGYGPSDEAIIQIVDMLDAAGQSYSADEIDQFVYEKEDTWVMYAYNKKKPEYVEGVMIAERTSGRMHIIAYAVNRLEPAEDNDSILNRLASGIAWEGVQTGAVAKPSFGASLGDKQQQIEGKLDVAYSRYRGEKVEPPHDYM